MKDQPLMQYYDGIRLLRYLPLSQVYPINPLNPCELSISYFLFRQFESP